MQQGSFDIRLELDAPHDLWDQVKGINEGAGGHVIVTPQWMDADVVGDTAMLTASRYTGVVLNKEITDGVATISGAHMHWWLGDEEGKGDIHETALNFSAAGFSTAITQALPPSITAGTIGTGGGTGAYTGSHQYVTPLEVIRSICAVTQSEYEVTNDGKLDADINSNLFTLVPDVFVGRLVSGSDPEYKGVPIATARTTRNSRQYATRALLVDVASDGSKTLRDSADATAATGKDIHGNTIDRTVVFESPPGDSVTADVFLENELSEHAEHHEMELTTGFWELINGGFSVGDAFYVYDPPGIVDTSNVVWFRGDYTFPMKLRLISARWPLVRGMGVWHRDGDATYTDLTEHVQWDVPDAQIVDTGQTESALRGGQFTGNYGATTLTVRTFTEISGACL